MNSSRSPSSTAATLPDLDVGAQVLHHLVGLQHVGADLAAPAHLGLLAGDLVAARPRAPPRPCAASIAFSRPIARSRFWSWLRSSCDAGHEPVGTWMRRTADDVLLTCWPPAPDDRYTSMRMSLSLISTSARVDHRPHLHGGEARLAAALVVERADAHQPVRAPLARHQPVGVAPGDRELGRQDARPRCPRRRRRPRRRSRAARPSACTCAAASRPSPGRRRRRPWR